MISKRIITLGIAVVIVALVSFFKLLLPLEWLAYDEFFRMRPSLPVSDKIVIITIDDKTLSELGTWPLPRDFHASLVEVLTHYGVKSIVFDLLFSEESPWDKVFMESLKRAPKVFMPIALNSVENGTRAIAVGLDPVLSSGVSATGYINVPVEFDGKIRQVPLMLEAGGRPQVQLAFLAASDWLKSSPDFLVHQIPLTEQGNLLVNFPNRWEQSFKQISYIDVLRSYKQVNEGLKPDIDLNQLNGKICFIGLTATGTSDLRANPLESNYPMVGLQASVLNSVVTKHFLKEAPRFINVLFCVFVLLIGIGLAWKLSPLRALGCVFVLAIGSWVGTALLFWYKGYWIEVVWPFLITVFSYLTVTTWRLLKESHQRQLIEKELSIAAAIQKKFLPERTDVVPNISLAAFLKPAKFVGGDLYDIVKLGNDRVGVLIGDVAGKGVSAALIMAQTISLFRMLAVLNEKPSIVLDKINKELCGRISGRFVTALYMILDSSQKKLYVSCAGHGPLMIWRHQSSQMTCLSLESEAPLGIAEGTSYRTMETDFINGDKLCVYSDGIIEALDSKGEQFGAERVQELLKEHIAKNNPLIIETILKILGDYSSPLDQYDDITMIVASLR